MDDGPGGLLDRHFTPAVHAAAFQDFSDGIAKCNAPMKIADYDARVIGDLRTLHNETAPLVQRLGSLLERFDRYEPRLSTAVERVEAGDRDWFTKPLIDSYHTVWFELHEDLLSTLGKERASEESKELA